MQPQPNPASTYQIWGADNVVYGPVELPTLIEWVKDERVLANTWLYNVDQDSWHKASRIPELRMFFVKKTMPQKPPAKPEAAPSGATAEFARQPGALRRIKVFADFSDSALSRFVEFMEIVRVNASAELVKRGQPGDAMYFVLEGELRARMMVAGKETTLATLGAGDFFGEISLFDHGPRSADVIANRESVLLKVSTEAFENLLHRAPDLASPFLIEMGKTLTARIRADHKRFRDSVNFPRNAHS